MTAWVLVLVGFAFLVAGYTAVSRENLSQTASYRSMPWFGILFVYISGTLLLAGANVDSLDFAGKRGSKKLLRNALISIGAYGIIGFLAISLAITQKQSVGNAIVLGMTASYIHNFFRR